MQFNRDKFQRRQDVQMGTATMGAAMAFGFLAFPALGVYAAIIDPTQRKIGIIFATGSLMLPLLVGILAWPGMQRAKSSAKTLKESQPALVVNQAGVQDNSSTYAVGFIPWEEIASVISTTQYSWDRYQGVKRAWPGIAFVVKDMNSLLRRQPILMSQEMRMDPNVSARSQIFIPQAMLDADVNELVIEINNFRARVMS